MTNMILACIAVSLCNNNICCIGETNAATQEKA